MSGRIVKNLLKGIDTGKILLSRRIEYSKCRTVSQVREMCQNESLSLLIETVKKIEKGESTVYSQPQSSGNQYYMMHPFFDKLIEHKTGIKTS